MIRSAWIGGPHPSRRSAASSPRSPDPRLARTRLDRKKAHVADGVGTTLPVFVVAAGGGVLVDVDGNSLIDLGSGIAVTTSATPRPRSSARCTTQVAAFTHTCFMVTPYDGYVDVCEAARRADARRPRQEVARCSTPAPRPSRTPSRSPGWRPAATRSRVFDHAYHGRTNLTMAMTAKNMPYKNGFGPFAGEVYRAPMSYPFRDGLSGEEAAARAIDVLDKQVGAANLACIVIEPIQGEGGFVVPAPGFLPALAAWAKDNGIVFIADEIQTGFCRTGDWFACDHEGVVPDLVTTGQGHRRRAPARRGHRPRRADGHRARRRPRRHLRRQPGRLRRRARRDRGDADARPRRPGPRDRRP